MTITDKIKEQLQTYPIVLYLKGTVLFPQCGFSANASHILQECLSKCPPEFAENKVLYVNVLEDPEIREGIKVYGQWPTIPQLYIKGELIGGNDIITELHKQGELQKLILEAV